MILKQKLLYRWLGNQQGCWMMGSNGSIAAAAPRCDCCADEFGCPLSPAEKVTPPCRWPYEPPSFQPVSHVNLSSFTLGLFLLASTVLMACRCCMAISHITLYHMVLNTMQMALVSLSILTRMPGNAALKWTALTLELPSGVCLLRCILQCPCDMVAKSSSSPAWVWIDTLMI